MKINIFASEFTLLFILLDVLNNVIDLGCSGEYPLFLAILRRFKTLSPFGRTSYHKGKDHTFEEKILSQRTDRYGYKCVSLQNGKHRTSYTIHSLVAKAFLQKPENATQIDHIDGNKENNNLSNLEWVTAKENIRRAYLLGLRNYRSKSVLRIKGDEIKSYETISDVLKDNNFSRSYLHILLSQEKLTKDGYLFIYEEKCSPQLIMCPEKIKRLQRDIRNFKETLTKKELESNAVHFDAILELLEKRKKHNDISQINAREII